ncbi:MAG: YoaK family protein [Plesiomonas sp.]|uniref:YoaK family protein n=1 Tax=Plesiomonas sp. TaxID=2486279 RepID=UPI003F323439
MIGKLPRTVWYGGFILAACAGLTNAIAVLGFTHNAISYLTGMVAKSSIELAGANLSALIPTVSIITAFLVGAMLSGFIVKNESLCQSRSHGVGLLLESTLLFFAYLFFNSEYFVGELLAAAACGLQNAMVTTYSGSVIRTTHLTGIISDLGASLGHWLAGKNHSKKKIAIHCMLIGGFFVGGVLGTYLFAMMRYAALLIPASIIFVTGIGYIAFGQLKVMRQHRIKILQSDYIDSRNK